MGAGQQRDPVDIPAEHVGRDRESLQILEIEGSGEIGAES